MVFTKLANRSCAVPKLKHSICALARSGCEALEGELPGLAFGRLIPCIAVVVDTGLLLWAESMTLSVPLVCLAWLGDFEAVLSDALVCKLVVFLELWDIGCVETVWALSFAKEFTELLVRPCMGLDCMLVSNSIRFWLDGGGHTEPSSWISPLSGDSGSSSGT